MPNVKEEAVGAQPAPHAHNPYPGNAHAHPHPHAQPHPHADPSAMATALEGAPLTKLPTHHHLEGAPLVKQSAAMRMPPGGKGGKGRRPGTAL
jgi:hypothetical protein